MCIASLRVPSAVARAVCSRAPSRPRCAPQDGWTALHGAAYNGYGAVVDALLRAGADPNSKTNVSTLGESVVLCVWCFLLPCVGIVAVRV